MCNHQGPGSSVGQTPWLRVSLDSNALSLPQVKSELADSSSLSGSASFRLFFVPFSLCPSIALVKLLVLMLALTQCSASPFCSNWFAITDEIGHWGWSWDERSAQCMGWGTWSDSQLRWQYRYRSQSSVVAIRISCRVMGSLMGWSRACRISLIRFLPPPCQNIEIGQVRRYKLYNITLQTVSQCMLVDECPVLGIKKYNKMAERLIKQMHMESRPNIAIKCRKKKPQPAPSPTPTEIEAETHLCTPSMHDYTTVLSQENTQPSSQSNFHDKQIVTDKHIDHHVYRLLKRINLGKNFSDYISRASRPNSKVMFHNSLLAENINAKTSSSTNTKNRSPSRRVNTWVGCTQSPFFMRKSEQSSSNVRVSREKNRVYPDYNLNKILVATQFPIQALKQANAPTQGKASQQEDPHTKKRRSISYSQVR